MECFAFIFIYIVLGLISFFYQKKIYKTILTPISFFSLLWSVVGIVVNLNLKNYYPILFLVNVMMILGIIIFSLSFSIGSKNICLKNLNETNFFEKEMINFKLVIIIEIILFLIMLPKFFNSIKIIQQYGFLFLRANLADKQYGAALGGIYETIIQFFVEPFIQSLSIINICYFYSGEKSKLGFTAFFFSLILIVMYSFLGAGRIMLFFFLVEFIIISFIFKKNFFKYLFNNKKVLYCFTLKRSYKSTNFFSSLFDNFYIYFFSGPGYLSRLIENETTYGLLGKKLYGSATFGFIFNLILLPLSFFTGKRLHSSYILGSLITNKFYYISPELSVNAMCTCFYSFIIDWGYFGIFIGPLFLGLFSAHLFVKTYKCKSLKYLVIYLGFMYILFYSVFKLTTYNFLIPVLYFTTFICIKKRKEYYYEKK